MQIVELDPKDIEQIFHPTRPIAKPGDALHRLIYSAKTERYFTLTRLAGTFQLMGAAQPDYDYRKRKQPLGGWFESREFDAWDDVLAWAAEFKAVILLPQPIHQVPVIEDIYRLVFGSAWDTAIKIDGWPECSKDTWMAIAQMFMEFDRQHHPDVLAGGRWMNNGFSGDNKDLKKWEVKACPVITSDTPFRFEVRRWITEDGTLSDRHRVTKHYQGSKHYDSLDDYNVNDWDGAMKLCLAPEALIWERTDDLERGYAVWRSQWVAARQEVCCAA
jgi:hypothetical protein